jgi:hypothetical protein
MKRLVILAMTGVAWTGALAQAPAPAPAATVHPTPLEAPTVKDPVRFSAFAVSMQEGLANEVFIAIERWSTDAERANIITQLAGAELKTGGQAKLLKALQAIEPRVGFIRVGQSMGWDLKYAHESFLSDGTRQIVISTDKPVSVIAGMNNSDSLDYPFTLVEMRMGNDNVGEGKLLAATEVSTESGKLQLRSYGLEPVKLNKIQETQKKPKEKKK